MWCAPPFNIGAPSCRIQHWVLWDKDLVHFLLPKQAFCFELNPPSANSAPFSWSIGGASLSNPFHVCPKQTLCSRIFWHHEDILWEKATPVIGPSNQSLIPNRRGAHFQQCKLASHGSWKSLLVKFGPRGVGHFKCWHSTFNCLPRSSSASTPSNCHLSHEFDLRLLLCSLVHPLPCFTLETFELQCQNEIRLDGTSHLPSLACIMPCVSLFHRNDILGFLGWYYVHIFHQFFIIFTNFTKLHNEISHFSWNFTNFTKFHLISKWNFIRSSEGEIFQP